MSLIDQIVLKQLEDLQTLSLPILHLLDKVFVLMAHLVLTRVLKTTTVPTPTQVVDAHSEVKVLELTAKVRTKTCTTNTLQTP